MDSQRNISVISPIPCSGFQICRPARTSDQQCGRPPRYGLRCQTPFLQCAGSAVRPSHQSATAHQAQVDGTTVSMNAISVDLFSLLSSWHIITVSCSGSSWRAVQIAGTTALQAMELSYYRLFFFANKKTLSNSLSLER